MDFQLNDEQRLISEAAREFADREIRPAVREMDEHAKIGRPLIDKLFDLGVMGIEIPESHGGAGATFFHSVLAVEALRLMEERKITAVVVVSGDRTIEGVVHLHDLWRTQMI